MYQPARRRWNSLSDFRDHLIRDTKIEVKKFNGHELITRQGIYTLAHGEITAMPKVESKKPNNAGKKAAPAKKAPAKKKAAPKNK